MIDIKIVEAQREIIQGYYNRILTYGGVITMGDIIEWLESDLDTIRMDNTLLNAETLLNK